MLRAAPAPHNSGWPAHRQSPSAQVDRVRSQGSAMSVARCLVIQGESAPPDGDVAHALTPDRGFACDVVDWSAVAPENLPECRADLIVAVAIPDPGPALRLFDWLVRHPLARPVFAVLPAPADEAVLDSAA